MRTQQRGSAMSEFMIMSVWASVLIYYALVGAAPDETTGRTGPLNQSTAAGTGALLDRLDEDAIAFPGLTQSLKVKQDNFITEIQKL